MITKIVSFNLTLLILVISLISATSSQSSLTLLGIPPQDENYFKEESIKCKNGSKKFSKAQLNDGFCDCIDGTDEPGTSACPQGKFYCQNTGHIPVSLYSSRVNDGICDCCDGSDEYNGKVKCPNTCWEAGKVARDKLQKKIDMYKEGVVMRQQIVELAKQEIAKDKEELTKLKSEEKVLKRLVKKLEARKEQIEKEEERERMEKEQEKEETSKEIVEDKDETKNQYAEEEMKNSKTTNDDQIGALEEPSKDQTAKEENLNTEERSTDISTSSEEVPEEISESNKKLSREELGQLVASRWTGEKGGHEVDKISSSGGEDEGDNESPNSIIDKDDQNVDKESSSGNKLDSSSTSYMSGSDEEKELSEERTNLSSSSWLETAQNMVRNLIQSVKLFSNEVDNLDADQVRKEYDDSSTKLSDIQEKISSLTEKLKQDFGVEKEFYFLYDQCFETKQDKYVYKVCPFKDAHQEEGYSKTQLGKWEKFENSYVVMLFSNGDRCWNGPDRSLKVKLRCGLKTELADVDEPSRCEYIALLTTPVRCLEGKLGELKHKLESLYNQQPHSHDEL